MNKKLLAVIIAALIVTLDCILLWRQPIIMAITAAVCIISVLVSYRDIKDMTIPDIYLLMLFACGMVMLFADTHYDWLSHVLGAVFGLLLFAAVAFIGSKVSGREALGGGDIELAFVSGLILGWERLLLMLIIASVVGSIVMIILRIKNGRVETPFAPFMSLGLITALLVGQTVIDAYISLFVR